MDKEFKPLFGGVSEKKEFLPLTTEKTEKNEFQPFFEEKPKPGFGEYIEAAINTLAMILERDDEFPFDATDLLNLKADIYDNCSEVGDILNVIYTYLMENGVDDPEEYLVGKGILE